MTASKRIAIIDYGAGNLHSVVKMIDRLGYQPNVTTRPEELERADAAILPGVGAAGACMTSLRSSGMDESIKAFIARGKPFLGICLGLQILFSTTEEDHGQSCLGIYQGKVVRLPSTVKTPHMGWNQVKQVTSHPVFKDVPDNANFYFVHSYYSVPDDKSLVAGETEYGVNMCSVITRGNLVATQFHPEKSGEIGLKIFDNVISLAG